VGGRSVYTVKLGDTLSDIARRFETTVEILQQVGAPTNTVHTNTVHTNTVHIVP